MFTNFSLTESRAEGDFIIRRGKIFEAGDYPDKGLSVTPAELLEVVRDFKKVPVDLEHTSTVLDGRLGELRAVEVAGDGRTLVGTVALPRWLDQLLKDGERKVSTTWDATTKRLTKLAIVRRPRVADAALLAAFSASEMGDRHNTPEGQSAMQFVHDFAASKGALCQKASFVSRHESKALQELHDVTIKHGAKCGKSSGMFSDEDSELRPRDGRELAREHARRRNAQMNGEAVELSTEAEGDDEINHARAATRRYAQKRNEKIVKYKKEVRDGKHPFHWKG